MINGLRLIGPGLFLIGLMAICPESASAKHRADDSVYACVRLDRNPLDSSWLRMLKPHHKHCRRGETRMVVVASKTLPFFANAARPVVPGRSTALVASAFSSVIIPTIVSVPASAPLLIGVVLRVNTDTGMYTLPRPAADGRDTPSSLECVPVIDGEPVGLAKALGTNAEAIGQASASGMFDPKTGGFDHLSPGYFPETLWSIRRESREASAGRHQVALSCEGSAPFAFRGVATLTLLQQPQ
jgi:hypothetical protein